jgi:glycosyltransferase involved in cell wall biosynthesis
MSESPPVSVLILTLNEEKNLPGSLASVAGFDDLVVLDSGSTDRTAEIARAAGARVFVNPFQDFADQRNHAHEMIPFKHPWVLHLDADEIVTPELAAELAGLPAAAPIDGYYIAPRMMFHGRWLRRCTDFPAWQARCARARGFRFIQAGHGQREAPDMRMGYLQASYLHDISVDDEGEWEARHQRYARAEAAQFLATHETAGQTLRTFISGPALARRRALKRLSYALPARPLLRFLYQYVLRGGMFDGRGAWRYCRLLARYERIASAEITRQRASHDG